jgi:hypothetical protein
MIHDKIAKLGEYPQHLNDLLDMGHEIATLGGLYVEQNAWLVKALALAREWIALDCPHSNCPHQHDRPGVECSCSRSALLAAITAPGETRD